MAWRKERVTVSVAIASFLACPTDIFDFPPTIRTIAKKGNSRYASFQGRGQPLVKLYFTYIGSTMLPFQRVSSLLRKKKQEKRIKTKSDNNKKGKILSKGD